MGEHKGGAVDTEVCKGVLKTTFLDGAGGGREGGSDA